VFLRLLNELLLAVQAPAERRSHRVPSGSQAPTRDLYCCKAHIRPRLSRAWMVSRNPLPIRGATRRCWPMVLTFIPSKVGDLDLITLRRKVKFVFLNTRDCNKGGRDEYAWCLDVLQPLIRFALQMYGQDQWWSQSVYVKTFLDTLSTH
jgi:hypothetical protein